MNLTPDPKPFLDAAIKAFKFSSVLRAPSETDDCEDAYCCHNPTPTDDDFYFLSELLAFFAEDENYEALRTLVAEYDALFLHLLHKKERPDLFFPERDAFERLGITLCERNLANPFHVIRDIGKLLRDNAIFRNYDFDQFHELIASSHRAELKAKRDDTAIAAYLRVFYPEFCRNPSDPERARIEEQTEDLIYEYLSGKNANAAHEPPPPLLISDSDDPQTLIATVERAENASEVEKALSRLAKMKNESVKQWALSYLEERPVEQLPILIANYTASEDDAFELWYQLKQIEVDREDLNGWHYIHSLVLAMERPPERATAFIYHNTFCSNCRGKALRQLHKAKMLTTAMINEALYDSNEDTKKFIKSLLV